MDKIINIQKKLNEFSFTKVIKKQKNMIGPSWKDRKSFISCNEGCCTLCEDGGYEKPDSEVYDGYQLKYVSHGAHALDFCESMQGVFPDESWNDTPVLFLFENPSLNYDKLYGQPIEGCHNKCPAQMWYWLHGGFAKGDSLTYPKYYRQGCYSGLVASLIKTFRLSNAYMTNFVKCAMNDSQGKHYLGTTEYEDDCISTCFKNILYKEIEILTENFRRELIVFAFSNRVYDLVQRYFGEEEKLKGKYALCLMPHPASRLANDYRKYVIFGKVYKTLRNNGIACNYALEEFLKNDKFTQWVSIRFEEQHRTDLTERFRKVKYGEKEISICDRKVGREGTGTIVYTPTEIKCRFKLSDGTHEFGFVAKGDGEFWIWDGNVRGFVATAEEVSVEFAELFGIFHNYISQIGQGKDVNVGDSVKDI